MNKVDNKELYSFDQTQLQNQLIRLASETFCDHNNFMKEYNLLKFRLLHPQLSYPDLLFTYNVSSSIDNQLSNDFKFFLNSYLDDKQNTKINEYSLMHTLNDSFKFTTPYEFNHLSPQMPLFTPPKQANRIYPFVQLAKRDYSSSPGTNISFISDFFCISTFPALFGHFASSEFIHAGRNFILRHIKDYLAPSLVSTFLLHCTQFQNRFLTTFTHCFFQLITLPQNSSSTEKVYDDKDTFSRVKQVVNIILSSFQECISYFTKDHIQAVEMLRKENEQLAIVCICDYFMQEVLSMWKYSPLLSENGYINVVHSVKNPSTISQIKTINIIDLAFDMLRLNEDYSIQLLNIFTNSKNYTEMPSILQLIYNDVFPFSPSKADLYVVQCLFNKENGKKPPEFTNVVDFIHMMFIIEHKQKVTMLNGENPPHLSPHDQKYTNKNLEENKAYHEFIVRHSKELKHFKMCCKSAFKLLKLKERQYAKHVWSVYDKIKETFQKEPFFPSRCDYQIELLTSFCFTIVSGYIRMRSQDADLSQDYQSIKSLVFSLSAEKEETDVIAKMKVIINNILITINEQKKKSHQNYNLNPLMVSDEIVYLSKYIINHIERIAFELDLLMMNETDHSFLPDQLPVTPDGVRVKESNDFNLKIFRDQRFHLYLEIHNKESYNQNKPQEPVDEEPQKIDENDTECQKIVEDEVNDDINPETEKDFDFDLELLHLSLEPIMKLIYLANVKMEKEYNDITEKFNIGQKLTFYLLIKEMIKKSAQNTYIEKNDPCQLGYFEDTQNISFYDHFRANLANCCEVFTKYLKSKLNMYPNIAKKIFNDLEYLQLVFNININ